MQLVNLQSLDLSFNKLSNISAKIGHLVNLQSLRLSNNQLSNIPAEIGELVNLQSFDLGFNELSNIPAEIGHLVNLQSLYLRVNQLSNIPAEIGELANLQSLDLRDNQLSNIPAEIGELANLQSLDLRDNQLSNIPAEIVQLVNLQSLELNGNKLSNIPAEIVQLVNLQFLDLSFNKLSNILAEIGQLVNLQSIDLSHNQLSNIPAEIAKLSKLKKLDLRGNPVPIPPEILGAKKFSGEPGDVKEILDFYFRVQDHKETEPLYEAKLLIIGEGGAGKTSLAKKIEDENYALEQNEKSTEGIDVIQWKFTLDNGHEFRVNIWDFGGQEIYHQTHQFFLTKRSLYALVADTRKENTDFYWWLKVAELLSDSSPVLIIKNEKQDRNTEVNERQLRGEFTNLKEVLATNLETNRGLAEIKQAIKQYISNLPHVGDKSPLPKLWVRVRSALENYSQTRDYLELSEYYRLCEINQLTDRQDMLRLSRYLHDLGVCLHFQDDSTLKHYVILRPEWGTNAVYKVLDNKTVKQNLGCFTQENLADIWQDNKYANMRDELLQLMMRFKLCYQIPNRPGNYIAPQLLDIEQPEYSWDKSYNLILRYKYEFMPKGILTRLIVETHPWIENQKLVWKNGVVLNKDETRALVIENYNQREIKVSVSGNRKKELLAVVTHELDKINQTFERLQYQTLVPCNCIQCLGTENPNTYPLEKLRKRLKDGRYTVECEKSYEDVDVRRLIDDVNLSRDLEYRESQAQNTPLQQELEREKQKSLNVNPTIIHKLSGQQRKKLLQALMDAYPTKFLLKQLLSFELDKNLDSIAGGDNLQEIVFNLIETASAEGWLKELVCSAKESNPENPLLTVITQEL
ncbi:Miro domain-containing protein [Calothrix sp. NIES-4071]|nr:Miro domain-containing protein [Calothrix sp. NIES-4071]